MRAMWIFPLAYAANVQGFLLFAPYAAVFLTLALVLRTRRLARATAAVRPPAMA